MGVGQKQAKAFMVAKDALQDDALLVHYDSSKQLVLAYDASPYECTRSPGTQSESVVTLWGKWLKASALLKFLPGLYLMV